MNGMEHIPQTSPTQDAPAPSSPAISDAIERLLANPELLSTVASAIGLGKQSAEPPSTPSAASAQASEAMPLPAATVPSGDLGEAVAAIAPLISAFSGKGGGTHANDPRSCLLRALKPYVSHNRAQAIDTMLQLALVSEAFKKLNEKGG